MVEVKSLRYVYWWHSIFCHQQVLLLRITGQCASVFLWSDRHIVSLSAAIKRTKAIPNLTNVREHAVDTLSCLYIDGRVTHSIILNYSLSKCRNITSFKCIHNHIIVVALCTVNYNSTASTLDGRTFRENLARLHVDVTRINSLHPRLRGKVITNCF